MRDGLGFATGLTVLLLLHWSLHIPAMEIVGDKSALEIVLELLL